MRIRIATYPNKTITFTSTQDVVVTMPIDVECTDPAELEFDLPDLTSITITGTMTSVTGGE